MAWISHEKQACFKLVFIYLAPEGFCWLVHELQDSLQGLDNIYRYALQGAHHSGNVAVP